MKNKLPKAEVVKLFGTDGLIPRSVGNVRTDVVHAGEVKAQSVYVDRIRPLQAGYSIGHPTVTAGTIGGFYKDTDNEIVILSNNHILAAVNTAKICDVCVQPGPIDKQPTPFRGWIRPVLALDQIGYLKDFVKLEISGNVQDSAILKVHEDIVSNAGILSTCPDGKAALGRAEPQLGMNVLKFGRTTGMTTGTITALNGTQSVSFGAFGTLSFDDCIYTTPMSQGGDSGSVLMYENGQDRLDIGLLFAGSPSMTLHNPISYAYNRYNLISRLI